MAFTEITPGIDWQSAEFLNEIVSAWNERMPLHEQNRSPFNEYAGTNQIDVIEAGDDIQAQSYWIGIQRAIVEQYDWTSLARIYDPDDEEIYYDISMRWLIPYDDPGEVEDVPPLVGWDAFCEATDDISDYGFRRATTWTPLTDDWTTVNDAMWDREENGFGYIEAGDIIGPWIFADIQTALDNMRTRYIRFQARLQTKTEIKSVSDSQSVSYADLVTAFNALTATAGDNSLRATHVDNSATFRHTLARKRFRCGMWARGANTSDYLIAPRATWARGANATDDVSFYRKVKKPSGSASVFDNNGDGFTEDIYNLVATTPIGSASAWDGSFTAPSEFTGTIPYAENTGGRGYQDTGTGYTILPFDFEWVKAEPAP